MAKSASEMYPSKWLAAVDLRGKPYTGKIVKVDTSQLRQRDGSDMEKIILQIDGLPKMMVLGKMNCQTIVEEIGDDYEQWTGALLTIEPMAMLIGGKRQAILFVSEVAKP